MQYANAVVLLVHNLRHNSDVGGIIMYPVVELDHESSSRKMACNESNHLH